jgi:hypothetical protein
MMRIRRKDGRIVTVPSGYIMQDGETIVVGAMFMDGMDGLDSVQRAVATGAARLHDGRGGPVGFKPGFVFSAPVYGVDRSCELRDAAAVEYERRRRALDYRGDGAPPPVGVVDGIHSIHDSARAAALRDEAARAYDERSTRLSNLWRNRDHAA